MAGIGFLDAHHRDAIGASFRRQPEIHDLGELLLQQRNEHFIQRLAQNAGLIRRPPGEGRKINRIAPHRDRGDVEHGKLLDRIVIARVVAIRAFIAIIGKRNLALDHDFGFRGHFQRLRNTIRQLHALPAQQPRKLIFRKRIRNRRHRGQNRSRIGADNSGGGQGHTLFLFPPRMMLRAAAMFQPAHQRLIFARHLKPIDAEIVIVLPLVARPLGHNQRPGDERRRLSRPAGLNRQFRKIDVIPAPNDLLAGGRSHSFLAHRECGACQR